MYSEECKNNCTTWILLEDMLAGGARVRDRKSSRELDAAVNAVQVVIVLSIKGFVSSFRTICKRRNAASFQPGVTNRIDDLLQRVEGHLLFQRCSDFIVIPCDAD